MYSMQSIYLDRIICMGTQGKQGRAEEQLIQFSHSAPINTHEDFGKCLTSAPVYFKNSYLSHFNTFKSTNLKIAHSQHLRFLYESFPFFVLRAEF